MRSEIRLPRPDVDPPEPPDAEGQRFWVGVRQKTNEFLVRLCSQASALASKRSARFTQARDVRDAHERLVGVHRLTLWVCASVTALFITISGRLLEISPASNRALVLCLAGAFACNLIATVSAARARL